MLNSAGRGAGRRVALIVVTCLALLAPGTASAQADEERPGSGHVYVLDNNLTGSNSITVFNRARDGHLSQAETTNIGGLGSVVAFADGTEGSLILSANRRRLFAADAGSDQVSVVDVRHGRLNPVGVFASGGAGPVSLTFADDLLYVLNAANASPAAANVAGFHVDESGKLHPIPGATRPLSAPHPNPAQVLLDPEHHILLVSEKGTNLIDLYDVASDGSLSGPTSVLSVGAVPFGMAFVAGERHSLIVADALGGPNNTGAATAYRVADDHISLINGPVPDHQIAPCWMVVTRNGRFAYTSNADSQTISAYSVRPDGHISLLDANGATATTPSNTFPLEEALSRNSRFLYVLDSRLLLTPPRPATLSGWRIRSDGHLTSVVDPSAITLPLTAIGLAAD
jgi:6-phosphogluconolactonase